MTRTTAIGYYHQNMVGLVQRVTDHLAVAPADAPRARLWRVRAKQVVLAQGALEKPLVFDGNDRPGVMLSGAAQTYLNRYGVKVGNRPAVVTCHDSAWRDAFDLAEAGVKPVAIVDVRRNVDPVLVDRAGALGIETLVGWTVTRNVRPPEGEGLARQSAARRFGRCSPQGPLRCGPDVRRLDAEPAPLQPYERGARLGPCSRGVPSRQGLRGGSHDRRRPRPVGHRFGAGGRCRCGCACRQGSRSFLRRADLYRDSRPCGHRHDLQGNADRPRPVDRQGLRRPTAR